MSYILLLVFSTLGVYNGPKTFSVSEFQSKAACELALKEARKFYRTVNADSKCIPVEKELHKEKLKQELDDEDDDVDSENA